MNSNVIPFPKPDSAQLVWECKCGSRLFHLYDDGEVQCAECEEISTSVRCYEEDAE